MSMGLSILHKDSKAVVNNPQFYTTTYAKGVSLRKLFTEIFPNLERKEILSKYSDRFSITNMMLKYNNVPEILVVQNRLHEPDMKEQYEHFINLCQRYKIKMDTIEFLFYHSNNGHDAIPNQKAANLVNSKFKENTISLLYLLDSEMENGVVEDQVYQAALDAREKGYKVYIAYKRGEFLTKLYRQRFHVINVDTTKLKASLSKIKSEVSSELNIVHVNSDSTLNIGLFLKKELDVSLVMTVFDESQVVINENINDIDIISTSENIKNRITEKYKNMENKLHIIPSSTDKKAFDNDMLFKIYQSMEK